MPRCRSLSHPYDASLSRMLIVFVATGLAFMLLPGTFVGVVTLMKISAAHGARPADAAWIQAHGHAQVFGWLGTFILGVGYYTIPRLRLSRYSPLAAWSTYALWTGGVATRWAVGSWPWHWRLLFPLAGLAELVAVAIFAVAVFVARPRTRDDAWRSSVVMITAAGWAMMAAVAVNAAASVYVASHAEAPVFPPSFNQRFLVLITWGFVVPFVWGFSSRWMPPLLGLRATFKGAFTPALLLLFGGVAVALAGYLAVSAAMLLVAALIFVAAMRLWERPAKEPKLRGVAPSTPAFLRVAYGWLAVAGVLGIVAAVRPMPNGYAGASRHALTVGFFAAVVFAIGPRVLPAFFFVRRLWSTRVMASSLVLLNVGCAFRVGSQILAYEGISQFAWQTLALSAVVEMTAVTLFAANMLMTLTTGSPLETFLEVQEA